VSTAAIPGLLEGRGWAKPLEVTRWVVGVAGVVLFGVTMP
jgi:hypothetical protein